MVKRVLCTIWGHVWKTVIATRAGVNGPYMTERCERCQVWK